MTRVFSPSFYLKGCQHFLTIPIFDQYSSINHPFDTISPRVKFLFSCNKFLKQNAMIVFLGSQNHINPSGDIRNSFSSILSHFEYCLLEIKNIEELRLYGGFDDCGNGFILEAKFFENLLKDGVNYIS